MSSGKRLEYLPWPRSPPAMRTNSCTGGPLSRQPRILWPRNHLNDLYWTLATIWVSQGWLWELIWCITYRLQPSTSLLQGETFHKKKSNKPWTRRSAHTSMHYCIFFSATRTASVQSLLSLVCVWEHVVPETSEPVCRSEAHTCAMWMHLRMKMGRTGIHRPRLGASYMWPTCRSYEWILEALFSEEMSFAKTSIDST